MGPEPSLDPADALDHTVRRYLSSFGPARPKDIASWAGVPIGEIRSPLRRIEIRHFRGDDGEELVDLPELEIVDTRTPTPIRFLPTFDATLLVHARRAGILLEEDRRRVFHVKNPQSEATFIVDGVVAGAWRYDGERIVIDPFRPLSARVRAEVEEEAVRLAQLFAL